MVINDLCTSNEALLQFKKQYDNLVKECPDLLFIDKSIRPVITALNSSPHIATRFCCAGHKEPNVAIKRGYIYCVCSASGMMQLHTIVKETHCALFNDKPFTKYDDVNVRLEYNLMFNEALESNNWINAYIIRFEYGSKKQKKKLLKKLLKAILHTVNAADTQVFTTLALEPDLSQKPITKAWITTNTMPSCQTH
jgi:uncharacterized Rmd1/YagE family protein